MKCDISVCLLSVVQGMEMVDFVSPLVVVCIVVLSTASKRKRGKHAELLGEVGGIWLSALKKEMNFRKSGWPCVAT
jgi:hypothetical protein